MTRFMPLASAPSVPWDVRLQRWLAAEPSLLADDALAKALLEPVFAAGARAGEESAPLRQALALGVHALDEKRAALTRLLAQVEQHEQLQAHWHRFDEPAWSAALEKPEAQSTSAPAASWRRWQTFFCEALAAWRLDACAHLLDSKLARADPETAAPFARGLQALHEGDGVQALALLDRLDPFESGVADAAALETRQRLLVLKARVLLHDLDDADGAALALDLATRGATGSTAGLVDAARGELQRSTGHEIEALASFQDAVARAPELPDGCVGLCQLLLDEGSIDEADGWLERAVQRALMAPEPLWLLERLRAPLGLRILWKLAQALEPIDDARARQAFERACELPIDAANAAADYELRANWRLRHGQSTDAANDLRAAARARVGTEYAAAAALLERAAELDPAHPSTYWYWADALYLASYRTEPPFADGPTVEAAIEVWNRGAALGPPRSPYGWAYLTRAVVAERQAWLDHARYETLLWQTVWWAEHSMLVFAGQAYGWSTLSRVHRGLENEACALEASRKASELAPDDLIVLEERVIILVNSFRFDEAATMMAHWRELGGAGQWIDAVEAHVLLNSSSETGVRERLERVLALTASLDNPWSWMFRNRARALMRLGRLDEGRLEWEHLLEVVGEPVPDDSNDVALARMMCGRLDSALELLARMEHDEPSQTDTTERLIGLAHLLRGDLEEARRRLEGGITHAAIQRALKNWTIEAAHVVEIQLAAREEPSSPARALLREMLALANRTIAALPALDTPIDELSARMANRAALFAPGTEHRRGALAVLGRSLHEAGRFAEALACYEELEGESAELARLGRARALQSWSERGDAPPAARGAPLDANSGRARIAGLLRSALQGEDAGALQTAVAAASDVALAIAGATASSASGSPPELDTRFEVAARELVRGAASELQTPIPIWRLDAALDAQARHDGAAPRRETARAARAHLVPALDDAMGFAAGRASTAGFLYALTRIRLYLGRALLQRAGDDSELMTVRWPELQRRMREETGIELPALHTQSIADESSYWIAIDDVPLAGGSVPEGGPWNAADNWKDVAPRGADPGDDAFDFILRHLDAVLRQIRVDFLGMAEVDGWLRRQRENLPAESAPACDLIRADLGRLQVLAQLLRSLAAERVPLVRGAEILAALEASAGAGQDDRVRRVRLALRAQLPGNAEGLVQVLLPEAVESELLAWLVSERGRGYLAMPAADTQEFLAQLRDCLAEAAPSAAPAVLVLRRAELRTPLWAVVAIEHPQLPVLAIDELLRPAAHIAAMPAETGEATALDA